MLSANKAKQLTQDVIINNTKLELEKIKEKINLGISKGEFFIIIHGCLSHEVAKCLTQYGYNVKTDSSRNEEWTTIGWE